MIRASRDVIAPGATASTAFVASVVVFVHFENPTLSSQVSALLN
jgi:hypothetical protein